jgi:hypothetical protein
VGYPPPKFFSLQRLGFGRANAESRCTSWCWNPRVQVTEVPSPAVPKCTQMAVSYQSDSTSFPHFHVSTGFYRGSAVAVACILHTASTPQPLSRYMRALYTVLGVYWWT